MEGGKSGGSRATEDGDLGGAGGDDDEATMVVDGAEGIAADLLDLLNPTPRQPRSERHTLGQTGEKRADHDGL